MEVEDHEDNEEAFKVAVGELLSMLSNWDRCGNVEFCLILREQQKPKDDTRWYTAPAEPMDEEPRLSLKYNCRHFDIPFVTCFNYGDHEPFRMWPDSVCGLASVFSNLRVLSLYFWDAEDHENLEYRSWLYDSLVKGLESLCGNLPRLRHLHVTRGSWYGIDEHRDEPKDFSWGPDRMGQAVRRLAQPTVRNLTLEGFFLSRDFFCSPDSEGSDKDLDTSDEDEWKALRHLFIVGEVVGANGKYFLKHQKNWTSHVSSLHWQGDATTLDPLVESFYTDVLHMPKIQDASLYIRDNRYPLRLCLSARREGKGSDGLEWCLQAGDGEESSKTENFSL